MAVISGTTVTWGVSPRIIIIPDTETEVTIVDLQDTCQDLEDSETGIVFPKLRATAGGEDLGGGVSVGWTMTLNNAQLQFEGRTTATESGAVSTSDTTGTLLNAAGGAFVTNGVSRGDTVFNSTTGGIGTVLSVTDNQNLITQPLSGGSRATWLDTDSYSIYINEQCTITGGNLVAVDDVGASISPVLQSANTNVVRSSASSATASNFDEQVQDLSDRVESLRPTHAGYGAVYYWDPENGSDTNDGLLRTTGVQTFAAAHTLASPGDTILGIAPSSGFVVDQVNITKKNIQVRLPGDNFWIKPATDVVPVIFNDADYSSISGVRISKATAGSANGVNIIDSDRVLLDEVNIHQEAGDCVYITNSYMPHLKDSWFHGSTGTGNGIVGVTGCNHLRVENCLISNNAGHGISLDGTTIKTTQIGWNTKIQFSGGYGLNLGADPRRTAIDSSVIMASNTLGDVNYIAANQVNFAREIENAPVANIQAHVESLRTSHPATGNDWYLDPVNGDNANDGKTKATSFKTWAYTDTFLQAGDTVNLVPDPASIITALPERIVSTKSDFHIRGPGLNFHVHPLSGDVGSVVDISGPATGVSMSGFAIHTDDTTSTNNGILMHGDENYFSDILINDVPGDGFKSSDCSNTKLERVQIINAGDQAVHITNCQYLTVKDCFIDTPALAGVRIDGNGSGDSSNTDIINTVIKDASTGIHIWAGSESIRIRADCRFIGTVTTPINDLGTNTHIEEQETAAWKASYHKRKHDNVANTITVYEKDNVTAYKVFDATDNLDEITPQ